MWVWYFLIDKRTAVLKKSTISTRLFRSQVVIPSVTSTGIFTNKASITIIIIILYCKQLLLSLTICGWNNMIV